MIALLASLMLFLGESAEGVDSLLKKIGSNNPKEVRLAALEEFKKKKLENAATVCKSLEQHVNDGEPSVRLEVLITLGLIANRAELECPIAVVEGIDDPDQRIRVNTQGLVYLSHKFPDAAKHVIFRATKSKDWTVREFAAARLPHLAGKSPEVVKKLKEMMKDPNEFVRRSAHIGHFAATENFGSYLAHLLSFTSEFDSHPLPVTKEQKEIQARRNLLLVGVVGGIHRFTIQRPDELGKELVKNLSHQDPRVRQATLRYIRGLSVASQESHQLILKAKPQAAIANLVADKDESVQEWAGYVQATLQKGPAPDAPQKLQLPDLFRELEFVLYTNLGLDRQ